jgi:outer membrane protein insertion porin family
LTRVRRLAPSALRRARDEAARAGRRRAAAVARAALLAGLLLGTASLAPSAARAQFDLGEDEPQVKRVEISGNEAYEDKTLRSIIRTRGKSFFHPWRDAPLRSDFLRYDQVALQDFYRRHGYLGATVESVVVDRRDGDRVVVRFLLREGPHATVQAVDFAGPSAEEEEVLRAIIPLQAGGPFDFPQAELSRAAIESLYAERGQVSAVVRDSFEIAGDEVRVRFEVEPGPSVILRRIEVEGTGATKPEFVSREVVLRPGETLARSRLLRSQQRIYDSGFYNDVQFSTGPIDSVTREADLIVSVRERRLGWIDAGIGVAYAPGLNTLSLDVLRVSGQVGQRNLFRDGVRFVATARLGLRSTTKPQFPYLRNLLAGDRRADISLTRDWLAGMRVQGTLGAFAEEVPPDTNQIYPYRAVGAAAGLRHDFGLWTRLSLVYQPTRVFSDSTSAKTILGDPIRSYTSNRVVVTLDRDTRLNLFDPRRGEVAIASAEFAGGKFGGSAQFLKLAGTASGYRPWGRKITLAIRGRVGIIYSRGQGPASGLDEALSRLDLIPLADRFFLGGATTVRGYHDNEIGQIGTVITPDSTVVETRGGSFLLLGNAEVRMRLIGFLGAGLFFDAGNVWEHPEDVTWRRVFSFSDGAGYKDMRYGAGVGVRIATPVGPVRLDYGWKLRMARPEEPDPLTGRGAFAFSLGQSF